MQLGRYVGAGRGCAPGRGDDVSADTLQNGHSSLRALRLAVRTQNAQGIFFLLQFFYYTNICKLRVENFPTSLFTTYGGTAGSTQRPRPHGKDRGKEGQPEVHLQPQRAHFKKKKIVS